MKGGSALSSFQPIRTERIYQKIVDQIKAMLQNGELNPGDRLPSEREIAEQLQVSRPAVREALSALQLMGLIEVRSGEGSFVQKGNPLSPFALLQGNEGDAHAAREMLEVRLALEGQAAFLAAQRATEGDLARIADCLHQMEQDQTAHDLGETADWEFHMAVTMAAHNTLLAQAMYHLLDALKISVQTTRNRLFRVPHMPERLLAEHRAIYQAIQERRAEEAAEAMTQHIRDAIRNSNL